MFWYFDRDPLTRWGPATLVTFPFERLTRGWDSAGFRYWCSAYASCLEEPKLTLFRNIGSGLNNLTHGFGIWYLTFPRCSTFQYRGYCRTTTIRSTRS